MSGAPPGVRRRGEPVNPVVPFGCSGRWTTRRNPIANEWRSEELSEIQRVARFKFHEGKVEEFKRLSAQFMEVVRAKDTGTLQFDIYFNDDESECVIHERYRDSEALMGHAAHVGDLMQAIFATGRIRASSLVSRAQNSLR